MRFAVSSMWKSKGFPYSQPKLTIQNNLTNEDFMNPNICLDQARALALKAKPGFMKFNGKTYTFEFSHSEWHYKVYEDMVFMLNVNVKTLSKAKQFIKDFLSN